jgi:hypothetical protein
MEVFRKIRPLQRHLVRLLAIRKRIANGANSFVRGLLFITFSCWQRRYEQILQRLPMAQ